MRRELIKRLRDEGRRVRTRRITDLFRRPTRFRDFSASCGDILYDYSKNNITSTTRSLLIELARESDIQKNRSELFGGSLVNVTEGRAAQHMALRRPSGRALVESTDVMPSVLSERKRMFELSNRVSGQFTDIVHIGIGGSSLGPALCVSALRPYQRNGFLRVHFVSNIDSSDFDSVVSSLSPRHTLFVIVSKTFTTRETLANARLARQWLSSRLKDNEAEKRLIGITAFPDRAIEFGISPWNILGFWDWVGGRYSVWSSVGLPLVCSIGERHYRDFLAGGHYVDRHFLERPLESNVPVLMGLLTFFHRTICGYETHAILPYDHNLRLFPSYLQQLIMESNGKGVTLSGRPVRSSSPIIWGTSGTDGEHSFFQLLHHSPTIVPVDFLVAAQPAHRSLNKSQHEQLVAHVFAQGEALMRGKPASLVERELRASGMTSDEAFDLAPHRTFLGNRPSSTFLYPRLTPFVLGQLIALYEHSTFVQSVLWDTNPFDQWGVELGKELVKDYLPRIQTTKKSGRASGLLGAYHRMRNKRV